MVYLASPEDNPPTTLLLRVKRNTRPSIKHHRELLEKELGEALARMFAGVDPE